VVGLSPSQRKLRVLIVEDKSHNRLLLRNILSILKVQIKEARNGKEAVEIFKKWQPDFIWMDLRMPVMDGKEATRKIRSLPGGERVVIVALSASAFDDERNIILENGIDDFVLKPVSAEQVFDCMKRHLSLKYILEEKENEILMSEIPQKSPKQQYTQLVDLLKNLDKGLVQELRHSVLLLNSQDLEQVLGRIGETDPKLAQAIRSFVQQIRYDLILDAIKEACNIQE